MGTWLRPLGLQAGCTKTSLRVCKNYSCPFQPPGSDLTGLGWGRDWLMNRPGAIPPCWATPQRTATTGSHPWGSQAGGNLQKKGTANEGTLPPAGESERCGRRAASQAGPPGRQRVWSTASKRCRQKTWHQQPAELGAADRLRLKRAYEMLKQTNKQNC